MEITTKYVSAEDFKIYFGIDLQKTLRDGDNPSNKVNAFIMRWENLIESYLDAEYFQKIDEIYPTFSDYQKKHYQLALLEQLYYAYYNGDLSIDSGYDQETGDKGRPFDRTIAPNALRELRLCGLTNVKIDGRYGNGYGGIFNGNW